MSPRLKNGLIIGGAALGSVVICAVAILVTLGLVSRSGLRTANLAYESYPAAAAPGYGVGGGGPAVAEGAVAADQAARQGLPMATEAPALQPAPGTDSAAAQQQIERMIIRNGTISMSVQDTLDAKARIEQIVSSMAADGAFVVSSNEYAGASDAPYINMQIRVPATHFDEVMDQIQKLSAAGTTPSVSTTAQDVTAEYVDVQARVQSLEAARTRLQQLMQNAETTEDLLMAEQQLTQREADLESLKGQMQYLSESARLSSISIDLQPYILSQPVDTRWRPAETVRRAVNSLVNGLRDFGDFLITFVIAVLPWLLLLAAVIYGVIRFIIWRVRVGQRKRAAIEQ